MTQKAIVLDDPDRPVSLNAANDETLAMSAAAILVKHYPGWPWNIIAESDQGIVHIRNPLLHPKYGYTIKLGQTQSPTEWGREVMLAGGTLLEAWNCPRGPLTDEAMADKLTEAQGQAMMMKLMRERNVRKHLA